MRTRFRPEALIRALALGALLFAGGRAMAYDEPAYTVVHRAGSIEYRQYGPHLIAETLVQAAGDFDRAGNEGFGRLFRYITGGNTGKARIAMTAPVSQAAQGEKIAMTVPVQQVSSADGWRIAFMLPGEYTLATAPTPTDQRIRVIEVPGRLMAVLRYSGRWTESNYTAHRDELLNNIAAAGVKVLSQPELARYNAPFSLPFLRRNEVLIEVNKVPTGATPSGR